MQKLNFVKDIDFR